MHAADARKGAQDAKDWRRQRQQHQMLDLIAGESSTELDCQMPKAQLNKLHVLQPTPAKTGSYGHEQNVNTLLIPDPYHPLMGLSKITKEICSGTQIRQQLILG